ncbi:hypothetical protein D3C77_403400 [compost metagenome]
MTLRGLNERINSAQHFLRSMAVDLHNIAVSRPDSCTNPVDSRLFHRSHIAIPYIYIRQEQKLTGYIRCHISHAHDRKRLAILAEIVSVYFKQTALSQHLGVMSPEALTEHAYLAIRRLCPASQLVQSRLQIQRNRQANDIQLRCDLFMKTMRICLTLPVLTLYS